MTISLTELQEGSSPKDHNHDSVYAKVTEMNAVKTQADTAAQQASTGKTAIVNSLAKKGVTLPATSTFSELATGIESVKVGATVANPISSSTTISGATATIVITCESQPTSVVLFGMSASFYVITSGTGSGDVKDWSAMTGVGSYNNTIYAPITGHSSGVWLQIGSSSWNSTTKKLSISVSVSYSGGTAQNYMNNFNVGSIKVIN